RADIWIWSFHFLQPKTAQRGNRMETTSKPAEARGQGCSSAAIRRIGLPGSRTKERVSKNSGTIGIAGLLAPRWKLLVTGVAAASVSAVLDLLQPWPLKVVVDYVVGSKTVPQWLPSDKFLVLNIAVACLVFISALGALASYVENVLTTRAGQWVTHDLRTTL